MSAEFYNNGLNRFVNSFCSFLTFKMLFYKISFCTKSTKLDIEILCFCQLDSNPSISFSDNPLNSL